MAKLPVVPPFANPIGLITDNSQFPQDYEAVWFQGTQAGAIAFQVAPSSLIGLAGPATVAYLKAQGLTFSGITVNGSLGGTLTGAEGLTPALSMTTFLDLLPPGSPVPTGQVQWFVDTTTGTPIATTTLVGGTSQITIPQPSLSLGNHTIYANYLGNNIYLDALVSAGADNQAVPTFDTITVNGFSSPHSFNSGNSLTFAATWTFSPSDAPTGSVQFYKVNFTGPPVLIGTSSGMSNVGGNNYAGSIVVTAGSMGVVTGSYFAVFVGDTFYVGDNSSAHGGNFALTVSGG